MNSTAWRHKFDSLALMFFLRKQTRILKRPLHHLCLKVNSRGSKIRLGVQNQETADNFRSLGVLSKISKLFKKKKCWREWELSLRFRRIVLAGSVVRTVVLWARTILYLRLKNNNQVSELKLTASRIQLNNQIWLKWIQSKVAKTIKLCKKLTQASPMYHWLRQMGIYWSNRAVSQWCKISRSKTRSLWLWEENTGSRAARMITKTRARMMKREMKLTRIYNHSLWNALKNVRRFVRNLLTILMKRNPRTNKRNFKIRALQALMIIWLNLPSKMKSKSSSHVRTFRRKSTTSMPAKYLKTSPRVTLMAASKSKTVYAWIIL